MIITSFAFLLVVLSVQADLLSPQYTPLKVGEIIPTGWLLAQVNDEANGLAGYLADFYSYIEGSTWIGGKVNDPGGLNERVPYWLNGAVPLAKMTGNQHLTAQVSRYIDYILSHQAADGWFGADCCEPWPRFPLLLALTQYAEANTTDSRTVPAIRKFLHRLKTELDKHPLSSWAQFRWQDLVLSIWWMYDYNPGGESDFLLQLAQEVYNQKFDWSAFVNGPNFPKGPCTGNCQGLATHGVNVGQGIKDSGVWYRYSKDPVEIYNAQRRTEIIDTYHGQASGIFSCSEHLGGLDPSQGTETCTVVETMYSYEVLFSVFGNLSFAERFEKLAYNALPSATTPDQWAHVYLQQENQINSMHCDPSIYTSDGPDSNIYGLEPNYGCCTVNFPQGWPKFVNSLFMLTRDKGIAAVAYGPSEVHTTIGGKSVDIVLSTDYPFGDTLQFTIQTDIAFPFHLKIPTWTNNPTVQIGNNKPIVVPTGAFYVVNCPMGKTSIVVHLPRSVQITYGINKAISVSHGPLVYSLKMGTKWTELHHYQFQSSDWQIMPTSAWNYALQLNVAQPSSSFNFIQGTVGKLPFSSDGTPVQIQAKGKIVSTWGTHNNAADVPPTSPLTSTSPLDSLILIPMGAAQLRIVEFPWINQ